MVNIPELLFVIKIHLGVADLGLCYKIMIFCLGSSYKKKIGIHLTMMVTKFDLNTHT